MDMEKAAASELIAMRSAWRALALRWDLSWGERRDLFRCGGEADALPPKDTEARMRLLIEVGHRVRAENDEVLRDWLRAPTGLLDGLTPLDVMSGGIGDLRAFRRLVELGLDA